MIETMQQQTTEQRREFILANINTLKQVDIAKQLKISPAAVNQILRGRRKDKVDKVHDGNFDYDTFFKNYLR